MFAIILVLYILSAIYGLICLFRQEAALTTKSSVVGGPAIAIGLLAIIPYPLAKMIDFALARIIINTHRAPKMLRENPDLFIVLMNLGVIAACWILIVIIVKSLAAAEG